jgi:hypothetical protein
MQRRYHEFGSSAQIGSPSTQRINIQQSEIGALKTLSDMMVQKPVKATRPVPEDSHAAPAKTFINHRGVLFPSLLH